jgi:hypothetical protein
VLFLSLTGVTFSTFGDGFALTDSTFLVVFFSGVCSFATAFEGFVFFTGVIDLTGTALAAGFVLIFLLVSFFTATLAVTAGAAFFVTGFTGVFDFETAVTFFSGVAFLAAGFY